MKRILALTILAAAVAGFASPDKSGGCYRVLRCSINGCYTVVVCHGATEPAPLSL